MRRITLTLVLVSVAGAASARGQSDPLAAIRQALSAKYTVTTPTADKTEIVTAGSLLTLKKSGLLTEAVTDPIVPSNTYRYGKITRGFMGQLARGSSSTRTFVAGEKLWVTDIEAKPSGIVFSLLSEQFNGTRYRASLSFPFQKGTPVSVEDLIAMAGEVFDSDAPAPGPAYAPPAVTPSAPDPVPTADWDPRYGRITNDDLERINDAAVRYDLQYLRLTPAALQEKPVMQYFIALNNCNHRDIERALFNELDYPALAAFYQTRAAQILASLPRTIPDVSFDRYIGGQKMGNVRMWTQSLTLGEYDSNRHAFPLRYPGKDAVEIPEALSMESGGRRLTQTCPAAQKAAIAVGRYLPLNYEILLRPASYREVSMDEASARQYIDSAGPQRAVFLALDAAITDSVPMIDRGTNVITRASFRAQVVRLRVIDARTQKAVGTLFDDGSLRPDAELAQTPAGPAPARKAGTESWSAGDHMYDIRMSVYVFLAADACGWPLTEEQRTNLTRFLDQVSNRGNFNERYQYNLVHSKIKNSIQAQGRMNYCANAAERRDFDKYAAMVAPLGPLAASGEK